MRITGLATGLDMDQTVKDSMRPYRIKIDETKQKRDIVEMKQQLYRDLVKESRDLYNKYFDVSKQDSLMLSKNWGTTNFESSDSAAVSVNGLSGGKADNYKVKVTEIAAKATTTIKTDYLKETRSFTINIDGKDIIVKDISDDELNDPKKLAERINKEFADEKIDVTVKYSQFSEGLVLESKTMGANILEKENKFEISGLKDKDGNSVPNLKAEGKDLKAIITNSRGETKTVDGVSNKVVFDGVEFSFNDVTTNEVRITGKTDTKATTDKIVAFVNDYNSLMEKLNTMTSEKRNKNYMPLTEEQKKEMSETEVKLWTEKTKQGQLYKDSDVTRIANKMKGAMSSLVGGMSLESMGIAPVKDYGNKNGTFAIDIDKLTKSLENNSEEVMNMFIGKPQEGTPESEKSSKTGILQKLKTILYDETVSVSSSLIKKAGIEGSSTVSNNELTKSIDKYNRKMADLEKDFSRREQALYSKYARLEVAMNKYNSQQSMMSQQIGGQ